MKALKPLYVVLSLIASGELADGTKVNFANGDCAGILHVFRGKRAAQRYSRGRYQILELQGSPEGGSK